MSNPNQATPKITVDQGLERFYAEYEPRPEVFSNYLRDNYQLDDETIAQTPINFSANEKQAEITGQFYFGSYDLSTSQIEIYPINIMKQHILPNYRAIRSASAPEELDLNAYTRDITDITCKNMLSRYADATNPYQSAIMNLYNTSAAVGTVNLHSRTVRRCLTAWGLADVGLITTEVLADVPTDLIVGSGLMVAIAGMAHTRSRAWRAVRDYVHMRQQFSPSNLKAAMGEQGAAGGFVDLRLQPEIVSDPESFYARLLQQKKEKPVQ